MAHPHLQPLPGDPVGPFPVDGRREPLIDRAVAIAVVTAVIVLGVEFGLPITEGQQNAVVNLVAIIAPLILGVWARRKVTPVASPRDEQGQPLVPSAH